MKTREIIINLNSMLSPIIFRQFDKQKREQTIKGAISELRFRVSRNVEISETYHEYANYRTWVAREYKCPICGKTIFPDKDEDLFCPKCGQALCWAGVDER